MPEKQAKDFGQADKSQLFQLPDAQQDEQQGSTDAKQIVLNIAESQGSKVLLRNQTTSAPSSNFLVQWYRGINDYFIDHSKISIRDKATTFRLLAVMINSGLSLVKSLRTLGVQSQKSPRLSRTLFEMAVAIEGGKSFSQAMADYPEIFNEAQVGMVRAGEASGQLNKTLKDIADETEKNASLASKVKGALTYPVVVFFLLLIVIFVMMVAVVPQLSKLFSQTGKALPLATQILITMSTVVSTYWYAVIGGFALLVIGVYVWKRTRAGRYAWDYMKLRVPIFGSIIKKAVLAKFARSLSSLLSSGVPIIKAIEIVSNAVGNEVYKKRLFLTAEDMRRGIPMAENMADSKLFPLMLVNMIEVGEQTAQLETVMLKIAEFYDEDVDNTVKTLTKVMEPLIIVVIGATVGGLVAAIMLPIIQLTNITGGF